MNALSFDTLAAVDLGSNSFHMVVARYEGGQLIPLETYKERVRLAGGLDADGNLTQESQERALLCLQQFGERLRGLPTGAVRAVGTSTLRKAHNVLPFLIRAREALGHPIEVITGRQEARTIYRGVATALPQETPNPRLVIDIGGGSTECVVGLGHEPLRAASLDMGCVSFTRRFFPDGRITRAGMVEATEAARRRAVSVRRGLMSLGWESTVGSSGTNRAIHRALSRAGVSEGVTPEGLAWLREALIASEHVDDIELDGISENRRPVIVGGVAVLSGVFEALSLTRMDRSSAALREGILIEMVEGRHLQLYRGAEARPSVPV
ncbi:MAG: Ppx/GppA family phosphatase [Alphaproteobacteria bacterium]|nr:Ppx/GppA family phosphatase [Alphaproteobacteria bacterium]MCB9795147.1 Ppx/GppA family phosphatase [Alphaproteobacteria bacterium]